MSDNPGPALVRIVLADDHRLVAEGLQRLLQEEFELLFCAGSGTELIDAVRRLRPDLVVSDLSMPDRNGLSVMRELRQEGNTVPFVFLTMHAEPALAEQALRAGAGGYVLKTSAGEELVRAIRAVISGRSFITPTLGGHVIAGSGLSRRPLLTEKQLRVLALASLGLRSKQIAAKLGVSVRTVESHKHAMMQTLGVHNTIELIRKAEEYGLAPAADSYRSP